MGKAHTDFGFGYVLTAVRRFARIRLRAPSIAVGNTPAAALLPTAIRAAFLDGMRSQ